MKLESSKPNLKLSKNILQSSLVFLLTLLLFTTINCKIIQTKGSFSLKKQSQLTKYDHVTLRKKMKSGNKLYLQIKLFTQERFPSEHLQLELTLNLDSS